MEKLTKLVVGTVAAGAMAVAAATPASARDHNDGIDAGELIAGALVIGGIAAVAAAAGRNNSYYDNDYRGRYDYGRYGYGVGPRAAVEQCVRAVERTADRYSYGARAKVTDIRNVDSKSYGYRVKGRVAVNAMGRYWRQGDGYYGRGWDRDYRGWNGSLRGYDAGSFDCKVDHRGHVADVDFSGIRGL